MIPKTASPVSNKSLPLCIEALSIQNLKLYVLGKALRLTDTNEEGLLPLLFYVIVLI